MKNLKKILAFVLTLMMISLLPLVTMAEDEKKGTTVDGIYVPYGTHLDYFTDEDIKNASEKLFSMLDPESEDTKDIYKLYKGGHHLEAMILFRNYMVDRIRRTPISGVLMNTGGYSWDRWFEDAYILIGEWTLEERNAKWRVERPEFNDKFDQFGYLNYIDPDLKMDLDWRYRFMSHPDGGEGKDGLSQPIYGGICGRLGSAYARTGNEAFVKKFFQVMESYATQYRPQIESMHEGYSEMTPEERLTYQENAGKDWGLYEPMRSRYAGPNLQFVQKNADIIGGLSVLLKCMPGEGVRMPADANRFGWAFGATSVMTAPMAEETYDLIDPVRFALLAQHLITGEFYRLTCYIPPGHIANQQVEGISNCFRYMCMFKDFTFVQKYLDDAVASLNRTFGVSLYPDGGIIEKSFNYNIGTMEVMAGVGRFAQMAPEFLAKLGPLGNAESYWNRLTEGYSINTGILPNVGNLDNHGTVDVWTNPADKIARKTALAKNLSLAYESVAYPYSGYVASRNGWDIDDLSLSFFNNDYRSSGHLITGTNAILSLSAYGRTMLSSGGAPYYGLSYLSDAQANFKPWYDEVNGYMLESSTRKLSTIMVNDSSQSKSNPLYSPIRKRGYIIHNQSNLVTDAPTTVVPYRWGTNSSFDFTEGKWQGGYSGHESDSDVGSLTENPISGRMADHYRNIIC